MRHALFLVSAILVSACATKDTFIPQSQYPPDPWVKGYSNPDDCIGGEQLAAISFDLPKYPRRAFNTGRQGWVIIRLDVSETGDTENVEVDRAVPDTLFAGSARRAVDDWLFEAPKSGRLENCRVLIRYRFGTVSLGS